MHAGMRYKMMFQGERFFTFTTLIRSLSAVQEKMCMKTMFVRKTFATMNANMWPFSSVYPCMCRKMMLQKKGLPAFRTRIWSFLRYTDLTSHILLLFDFCFDLRCIHMGQNVPEMGSIVRLTRRNIIRSIGLIRRSGCSLHQDFIALFCRKLQRSKRCHEVLTHGVFVCCCKN